MAVPGNSRPRSGLHCPHSARGPRATPAPPGRAARTRPRPAPGPGRRASGAARRRSACRPRPAPRTAAGRSTSARRPARARPGSSRKLQRIGWVTANTHRPPGRSTRTPRASAPPSRPRTAPRRTRCRPCRTPVANGRRQRVGLHQRHAYPGPLGPGDRVPEHPAGQVQRHRVRPGRPATARTAPPRSPPPVPGPGAPSRAVARRPRAAPPAPTRIDVAEELAVLGLVRVGVRVPPAAAGCARLRVGDRAPGHSGLADARLFDLRVSRDRALRCSRCHRSVRRPRNLRRDGLLPPASRSFRQRPPGVIHLAAPFGGEMCLSGGIACPEVFAAGH